ncbi:EamA-like transporter family [Burkholderiales bacterium JOSHI_001]|nr:EamA-like transporter family [Burkholderiales bacterium JOSHI_001]
MHAALLMIGAAGLFATMGVCVKWASLQYSTGEVVFYRGLVGCLMMAALSRGGGRSLRTALPMAHFWRSVAGVSALTLWFYAITGMPLAAAVTLNYMSSVWMALFMMGGAFWLGTARVDGRLVAAVLLGFTGVAMILRPTIQQDQAWYALAGLASGLLSAMAYLQVTALGRLGEPEYRIVFYFSGGGVLVGAALTSAEGWHGHTARGLALLLATGLLATSAQLMMTRAYAIGRTLANASLQYLGIVFSFLYGVWLFDDPASAMALAGMALVIAAGLGANLLRHHGTPREARDSGLPADN